MKFTIAILFAGFALLFVTNNFAQQPSSTPYQPINNGTLQIPPMQNPPKNITTNGALTYQNQPSQPSQPTAGFNSPFPTNLVPPNNANQNPNLTQQPSTLAQPTQPLQPKQPANPNPFPNTYPNPNPSPYPSTQPRPYPYPTNPNQPNIQPNPNPTFQPNPNPNFQPNPNPNFQPNPNPNFQPSPNPNSPNISHDNRFPSGVVQVADSSSGHRITDSNQPGHHVGTSTPAVRVHPFVLKPEEQKELDEFLLRWEQYSETINNYEVDFNAFFYDPTNPLSPPVTKTEPQLKPLKITFGYFKYVAPRKFVYHVEGEWQQKVRTRYIDPEITPNITAEKTIIDGQSLFFYDFPAKKVTQYRMPPEELNRTIANGPFPLIFGAKADDMKKRFSMKIVTNPDYKDKEIWLWTTPLLPDDQQEFAKIEIRLEKRTLNAMALKRIDPNEKSYTTYTLQNPRVNRFLKLDQFLNPDIPRGWKHEIQEHTTINIKQNQPQNTIQPSSSPAVSSPTIQPRTEVNLYKP